jgi:hypothetical protein
VSWGCVLFMRLLLPVEPLLLTLSPPAAGGSRVSARTKTSRE